MITFYKLRPLHKLTILFALLSPNSFVLAQSLSDDYLEHYSLSKAYISENNTRQASGRFELRGNLSKANTSLKQGIKSSPLARNEEQEILMFFSDNVELFDISNPEQDLRLISRQQDQFGSKHLRYHRYLGELRLQGMEIIIHINSSGKVSGANGNIVRVSDELNSEILFLQSQGTLPKLNNQQLISLASDDLNINISELQLQKSQAFAINHSPYVIWQVEVGRKSHFERYELTLSDSNGDVISRRNNQRHQF